MLKFLCSLLMLAAMSSAALTDEALLMHVVAADRDGLAISPTAGTNLSVEQFESSVDSMLSAAEAFSQKRHGSNGPVRILVFVHGGLNGEEDTTWRVENLDPIIMNDGGTDWYYPIYVRWPSDAVSTYGEQLMRIRQGNRAGFWGGTLCAPIVFASDTLLQLARTPSDWFYQTMNLKDRTASRHDWMSGCISRNWKTAWINSFEATNACFSVLYRDTGYTRSSSESFWGTVNDIWQTPIRVTVGTIAQGSFAQSAWKNMKRRTQNMVHPAPSFDGYKTAASYQDACVGRFFKLLCDRAHASTNEYEVVLIGHSMGTIVLNTVLTEYRYKWLDGKPILRDVVYMAAADTINNTAGAIVPLIHGYNRRTNSTGRTLQFHNLTLNRVADIAEPPFFGVTPHGSLLEWIDQHLETPNTPGDRTMGSEVNVLCSLHLFESVKTNCTFRAFDRAPGRIPNKHGDFGLCPFWRKTFWWNPEVITHGATNNYAPDWLKAEPNRGL